MELPKRYDHRSRNAKNDQSFRKGTVRESYLHIRTAPGAAQRRLGTVVLFEKEKPCRNGMLVEG